MPYATHQDMTDRFGTDELVALTDRANPPTDAIDATVLDRAIASAAAEIDAALAARYAVPVAAPVPTLLVDICCDLARWRLYDEAPSETVVNRADAARTQLRGLSRGDLVLPLPTPSSTGTQAGAADARIVAGVRRFTDPSMRGF